MTESKTPTGGRTIPLFDEKDHWIGYLQRDGRITTPGGNFSLPNVDVYMNGQLSHRRTNKAHAARLRAVDRLTGDES